MSATAAAAGGVGVLGGPARAARANGAILKPLPTDRFVDFGTSAEMRWDSVDPRDFLTDQSRLFVRNHTSTPLIDRSTYALRVYGDGLAGPRTPSEPLTSSYADLRRLPRTTITATHGRTGNDAGYFFDAVVRHPVTVV